MKYLALLCFFFVLNNSNLISQNEIESDSNIVFGSYHLPKATFPGGQKKLLSFIYKNLKWPASDFCGSGTSVVKFVVKKNGEIEDCEIVKGISKKMDEEIFRVLQMMPKWIPAEESGKIVECTMLLPIKIHLE